MKHLNFEFNLICMFCKKNDFKHHSEAFGEEDYFTCQICKKLTYVFYCDLYGNGFYIETNLSDKKYSTGSYVETYSIGSYNNKFHFFISPRRMFKSNRPILSLKDFDYLKKISLLL